MREIKFRGKDLLNKWRYGDLIQEKRKIRVKELVQNEWKITSISNEKVYMIKKDKTAWTVKEETIGQYTGLKDKNGKEIYEGDIVESTFILDNGIKFRTNIDEVVFNEESSSLVLGKGINRHFHKNLELKVIGNVWDNKDLLKERD